MAAENDRRIDIYPWGDWKAVSGYTTRTVGSSSLGGGYLTVGNASANGYVTWDVVLDAGTWTLGLVYSKYWPAGIITPSIGGTDLSTVDGYNATVLHNNHVTWTGISVGSSGQVELKLRTDTKNASSLAYDMFITHIYLVRTA